MNKEYIIIGLVSLSPFLYSWGGTGFKPARRFILPVILGLGAFLLGIVWYKALGILILSNLTFHLGYGENSPLWRKSITILCHGLCLAPLVHGMNAILMLIPPVFFAGSYWLSRKFNWFTWKATEAIAGFSLGISVCLMSLWQ